MDRNYIYENAPLQEVIIECFWSLKPLSVVPGAAIDQFGDEFNEKFSEIMRKHGFGIVRKRYQGDVPVELLPHRVNTQFRMAENQWPVYQIGPGVFTANMTPPYDGWKTFLGIAETGIDSLIKAYPRPKSSLNFESISVRYLNFFGSNFDIVHPMSFLSERLGLSVTSLGKISQISGVSPNEMSMSGNINVPLVSLGSAEGVIAWREETRDGQTGVFLEFRVKKDMDKKYHPKSKLRRELDACHDVISDWFEALVADNLSDVLGRRLELENE